MALIKTLRYEDQRVRLVMLDKRWWIFAEDAVPLIDPNLTCNSFFSLVPVEERWQANLEPGPPTRLVSLRYLIRRLRSSQKYDLLRFKTWLKAWKIVTGMPDLS